jgi:hypothetical protein
MQTDKLGRSQTSAGALHVLSFGLKLDLEVPPDLFLEEK